MSTCNDLQEMDGKPAPVDERSDEEVVQGFMAELWALQRGSAAKCSAGTAPGCSSSADVTAAGGSQQVNRHAPCASLLASVPLPWYCCSFPLVKCCSFVQHCCKPLLTVKPCFCAAGAASEGRRAFASLACQGARRCGPPAANHAAAADPAAVHSRWQQRHRVTGSSMHSRLHSLYPW